VQISAELGTTFGEAHVNDICPVVDGEEGDDGEDGDDGNDEVEAAVVKLRIAVWETEFQTALMVTLWLTDWLAGNEAPVAAKVTIVSPYVMISVLGTVTSELLDVSVIAAPPAGAICPRVIVQIAAEPGLTMAELQVSDIGDDPATPNRKDCAVPLSDAVMEPLPEDIAATWNEVTVCPAATAIEVGTVSVAPTPLLKVTVEPPDGAAFVSVAVHVAVCPAESDAGKHCKVCTPG
jgi:hypothetical protein